MPSRALTSRCLTIAVALAVTGWIPVPAAQARSPHDTTVTQITGFPGTGGSDCTVSDPGATVTPISITGSGHDSHKLATASETTDSADAEDTTQQSSSVTTNVAQRVVEGVLTKLTLSNGVSLSNHPGEPVSACAGPVQAAAQTSVSLRLATDGFLTVTTTSHPGLSTLARVGTDASHTTTLAEADDVEKTVTRRVFVRHGQFFLGLLVEATLAAPASASAPQSLHSTDALEAAFAPVGAGMLQPSGPGAAYLIWPHATDCATGHLTLKVRHQAEGSSVATFSVNGTTVKTMHHVAAGAKAVLALPPTKDAVVGVAFAQDGHILRGKRTYTACGV